MVDIHHEAFCDAPIDAAFAYINDYRTTTQWMFGMAKFAPVGAQDEGLGAEFEGTFHVTPVKLTSTVRVTKWVQDELIAFESINGFKNIFTWRFSAASPTRTKIDVVFSYELPGGLAGRVLGRAFEPIVALSVRHTDHALRREIEAAYAERGET